MKTLIAMATVLLLTAGCSKKDTSNTITPPVPTVLPDTLGTGWSKITTIGVTGFTDIFFANADIGYALSNGVYKSTDGGSSWQSVYTLSIGENLFVTPNGSVFFASSTSRIVAKSIDGGVNFTASPIGGTSLRLFDLYFTGNDTGYVPAGANSLYRTTNGGNTWGAIPAVTGLNVMANAADLIPFFINSTTGWISDGAEIYKTNGGASVWTACTFTSNHPSNGFITLYATSASIVYAGASIDNGHTAVYKSTNGGINFSLVKKFDLTGQNYPDIHFLDDNNGYVCAGRRIYKTTDGGISWNSVVALGNTTFVEIHFTDLNHGWACCSDGTILKFR